MTSVPRVTAIVVLTMPFVLGAVSFAAAQGEAPKALIDPYLRIQDALARDKTDDIKADAGTVAAEAAKLGSAAETIQGAARELERAAALKAARAAFGRLSEALVSYLDQSKQSAGADMHVAFCPMVRKPWLQKGTEIRNPYYGQDMLRCGDLKK